MVAKQCDKCRKFDACLCENKRCPKCGKFKVRLIGETEEGGVQIQGGASFPRVTMKHYVCDGCGKSWGE